jgi:hypothetical protein
MLLLMNDHHREDEEDGDFVPSVVTKR